MQRSIKQERTGIVLMLAAMIFFTLFIWWGTTSYPPVFAVGIIILAGVIFLAGIVTFNKGTEAGDKSANGTSQAKDRLNEP